MFGLLGLAEVIALLVIGGISAPLFLRPRRHGAPVLNVRRLDVNIDSCPAVDIDARQSGLVPRALMLVGVDMATRCEVLEDRITYQSAGIWHSRPIESILMSQVASAQVTMSQPTWHVSAIGVITLFLIIMTGAGRLTAQEFGIGAIAAGLCGVFCALQRVIELVIESSGGVTITLPFSAIGVGQRFTLQDVTHAAERITELAAKRQQSVRPAADD